jgi:hypothetical protein
LPGLLPARHNPQVQRACHKPRDEVVPNEIKELMHG